MTMPTFDPTSDSHVADPYPTYAHMRDRCPVFHDKNMNVFVVTRHEDVIQVAHDPKTYSSESAVKATAGPEADEVKQVLAEGWSLTPNLTESDGEEHTRLRLAVNRVFTPRRVAELAPFIKETGEELITRFAAAGSTDIIENYAWPLPLFVMAQILGIPTNDVPQLRQWSDSWLKLSVGGGAVVERVECARDVLAMQKYVMAMLLDPSLAREGLIASLAADHATNNLDNVELMRIVMNLIIAGHVTVTRSIGNGLVSLLENPAQLAALRAGDVLPEAMVEETLRFESPVQGLFRTVTTETELAGSRLRPGDRVMVHFGAANRDERALAEPDTFDIRPRAGRNMLAFGRGIHTCLGAGLARLQLQIAIPLLFDRLPGLRLGPAHSRSRERLVIARGFDELHLQWNVSHAQEATQ